MVFAGAFVENRKTIKLLYVMHALLYEKFAVDALDESKKISGGLCETAAS